MVPGCVASARHRLAAVGWFVTAGAVQMALSAAGHGFACPYRHLTGHRCPLCGTTSAALDLLGGRPADAVRANAFSVLAGLVLALACLAWLVEAGGGPGLRPGSPVGRWLAAHAQGVAVALALLFWVLRALT